MGIARRIALYCVGCFHPFEGSACPGLFSACSAVAGLFLFAAPLALAAEANDPWPGLVQDIFNNRPMNDGSDVISVEMPVRAEDAAIVPVTLRTKLSAR